MNGGGSRRTSAGDGGEGGDVGTTEGAKNLGFSEVGFPSATLDVSDVLVATD